MKPDQIIEVLEKLIGPIRPVADTSIDDERYENLLEYQHIADTMINRIAGLALDYHKDIYGSREKVSNRCVKWIEYERDFLNDLLNQLETNEGGDKE